MHRFGCICIIQAQSCCPSTFTLINSMNRRYKKFSSEQDYKIELFRLYLKLSIFKYLLIYFVDLKKTLIILLSTEPALSCNLLPLIVVMN